MLMRYLIVLFTFFIVSCGTYTTSSYRPKIKSLLAITETGDTVSVSMREFEKQKYDTYTRFNYNNNWYWNNWRYDFNWGWNQWWYSQPNRYWWNNDLRYTILAGVIAHLVDRRSNQKQDQKYQELDLKELE